MDEQARVKRRRGSAGVWLQVGRGIAGLLRSPLVAPLPARSTHSLRHRFAFQPQDLPALTACCPVLLTDDDDQMLSLNKMVLDLSDLSSIATTSARTALHLARRLPISLVVSDIMKPDMDGMEMLRHLRADTVTWRIPLLFATAHAGLASREEAWSSGAQGFISKPYVVPELIEVVCQLLLDYGNWLSPPDFDADLYARLTDPSVEAVAVPGWGRVRTTRRLHTRRAPQSPAAR